MAMQVPPHPLPARHLCPAALRGQGHPRAELRLRDDLLVLREREPDGNFLQSPRI